MSTIRPLEPTLWRTCRVIANRIRLEMFHLLLQEPGQTVSAVAARLQQPLSLTSEYLRALEARGLLAARRRGRHVEYRPNAGTGPEPGSILAAALRSGFKHENDPAETLFKIATAFAHPRRILIFRELSRMPRAFLDIQLAVTISDSALVRHLTKLEARGFIACLSGTYTIVPRRDAFGRELARQAALP